MRNIETVERNEVVGAPVRDLAQGLTLRANFSWTFVGNTINAAAWFGMTIVLAGFAGTRGPVCTGSGDDGADLHVRHFASAGRSGN